MLSSIPNVIIMFSCDLLQVNATLGSLLCGCESPRVGPFCAVSVMSWFCCLLAFAGLSVSSHLPSSACGNGYKGRLLSRNQTNMTSQLVNPLDLQLQGAATVFFLFSLIPSLSAISTAAIINFLHHPDCSVSVHLYSKTC